MEVFILINPTASKPDTSRKFGWFQPHIVTLFHGILSEYVLVFLKKTAEWNRRYTGTKVNKLTCMWPSGTDGHLQRLTIPDAVLFKFELLMMSTTLLETCRGL